MRYYGKSAGELSGLTMRQFTLRWKTFSRIHEQHLKMVMKTQTPALF